MPKVRLLAPWTNDKGEPQAVGAVVDVSDEVATELNNKGVASKLDDEKALEDQPGVYDARLERPEAPAPTEETPPSAEDTPKKK